ncbi:endonuclease/exonuclease/phosphatase family protein [Streptomyces sp. NPDC059718]
MRREIDRQAGRLTAVLAVLAAIMATLSPQAGAAPDTRTDQLGGQAGGQARSAQAEAPARAGSATRAKAAAQADKQWPNRVAQFNVCNPILHCGNLQVQDKPARIAAEIARYKPQVIALEEVCVRQTQAVADVLSFKYGLKYYVQHNSVYSIARRCAGPGQGGGSSFGSALLSAAPITQAQPHVYRPTNPPSTEPRGYVGVTTTVDGRSVRVFATHLAQAGQGAARNQQLSQLLADAGRYSRAIVLGDFNAVPSSPEMSMMGAADFHDADPACGPFPPEIGPQSDCKATADAGPPRKKFDYILLKGIQPPGIGVHPTYSDHDLVHADLDLDAQTVPTSPSGDSHPIDAPPTVDAGPDARGDEGSAATLRGSATDDHGAPTVRWSYSPGTDVDSGTTCRFGSRNAARSSFTCTDDGTFTVTLTASDGVNPPVGDSATVRLSNVAPTLHLTRPAPWSVSRAGRQTAIRATFTDPGSNDTHTCHVGWDGGGEADDFGAAAHSCNRSHAFSDPGMYDTSVSVADDDGGRDTAKVMLIVYDPTGGLLASAGTLASPRGMPAGGADSGTASFAALAKYLTTDSSSPQGMISFSLPGGPRLTSTALDWLVITPNGKAALKGSGRVDGKDGYGFLAYVRPGRFRAVVWPLSRGTIPPAAPLYDTRRGAGYDVDRADPQPVSAGLSIIDTGWIPGVPALGDDLTAALKKYQERTPKSLDVQGTVPLPPSGSASAEGRASATTGERPRPHDTAASHEPGRAPGAPDSPPSQPPSSSPSRSSGDGLLDDLLGLGSS